MPLGREGNDSTAGDAKSLGRMALEKQYHGELDATGKGEMLTAMTDVKGSAAYVAIEKVTGTLGGRRGTFALQHAGTMARGNQEMSVAVVPDSGTGQLTGLTGKMRIRIEDGGKHFYEFDYTLADAR
ncbi:MAG: DUF3224 domain-containing protein [Verrucomicrobiota bacterium]|nr:DUF3224 domain-containing protein [Verrucomicrobiota bacterium]